MAEVNKDTSYATDGNGYINRDGSSVSLSFLFLYVQPLQVRFFNLNDL